MLHISVFGTPTIRLDEKPLPITIVKAYALLYFLAVERKAVSRQTIVGLLWAETSEESARRSLRVLLTKIRPILGEHLITTRRDISLNWEQAIFCDAHAFADAVANNELSASTALYTGEFLSGFQLEEANEFLIWLYAERERLRQHYAKALHNLLGQQLACQDWASAESAARQLVANDSWDEIAYRGLMQTLARQGERAAAIAEYERCRAILAEEVSVEPSNETEQLLRAIRSGEFEPALSASPLPPAHNLPSSATRFVGRAREIEQITGQLVQSTTRLLTLVGPGGIGKTRLALEVGRYFASNDIGAFPNGIFLVPLEEATTSDQAAHAIARVLDVTLSSRESSFTQLAKTLRNRKLLLILDNFEQLVTQLSADIEQLLAQAQAVTLLVTSRERLRLSAEIALPLAGLEVDAAADVQPAVRLFELRAQRLDLSFRVAEQVESIERICSLVEGLPLAIELAAAWAHLMSCEQIEQAIAHNFSQLTDATRPSRHRNFDAVLDQSWSLLSAAEQTALANLTVFHGGFSAEAAAAVANCPQTILFALIEKSLVQRPSLNRYSLHNLLRQALAGRAELAPVQEAHKHHYLNWLIGQTRQMYSGDEPVEAKQLHAESENVRAALLFAIEQRDELAVEPATWAFRQYWLLRGWYQDGILLAEALTKAFGRGAIFGQAKLAQAMFTGRLGKNQDAATLLAEALAHLDTDLTRYAYAFGLAEHGVYLFRLGESDKASQALEKSVQLFESMGDQHGKAEALARSYLVESRLGNAKAIDFLLEALAIFEHPRDRARPLNYFGTHLIGSGDYAKATAALEESNAIMRRYGEMTAVASGLVNLSIAAGRCDQLGKATDAANEALALFKQSDEIGGIAVCYYSLAEAARFAGDADSAENFYLRAMTLHQASGNTHGQAIIEHGLANVAAMRGRSDALAKLLQVAASCQSIGFGSLIGNILSDAAPELARRGALKEAIAIATFCAADEGRRSSSEAYAVAAAQALLQDLHDEVSSDVFEKGRDVGLTLTQESALDALAGWLSSNMVGT